MRRLTLAIVAPTTAVLALAACQSGNPGSRDSSLPAPGSTASSTAVPPAPTTATPPLATTAPASIPSSASPSASRRRTPSPTASPSSAPSPTATAPVTGTTVVLNPGHDGGNETHTAEIDKQVYGGYGTYKACDTTGTNTDAGYPEHAFTWDVSLRVRTILQAHGVRVVMTRPNDTGVGPCVNARAAIGNHPDVAAVVSIHADGAPAAGHGFHVNQDSRTPEGATQAVARQSDVLGQKIHAALVSSSGLVPSTYIGQDGYFYRTDLAGLDLATRPATFLELGNMRNAGDAALLSSASGRQRIAGAVAAGILAFLGR